MNLTELVFIYLTPLIYNGIFIVLWVGWFIYNTKREDNHFYNKFCGFIEESKWFYPVIGTLIFIFTYFLLSYAAWHTDVDDAISSGVVAFLKGKNPFAEKVVVHLTADGEIILGTYHYFPPDLFSYSIFYLMGGFLFVPLLNTYWFLPFHLFLLIPTYFITRRIVDLSEIRRFMIFTLFTVPFFFTNSILMLFFFVMGYYLYDIKQKKILGMILYVMAASVKYMVGILIIAYLWDDIREIKSVLIESNSKKITVIKDRILPYIVASLVLLVMMIPFGVFNVLVSTILYQGVPSMRNEVAQTTGPLLIEFLYFFNLTNYYLPALLLIMLVAFLLLRNRDVYEFNINFSFLSMLVLPFYATELFITVIFFILFEETKIWKRIKHKKG